jgi:HK97 family phage major capsid protein/HK97 family phage prohead protease
MTERITFATEVSLEGRRHRGSVQLAGARTRRNGEWLEIDPAALVGADATEVVARWNHDPEKVLGRMSNGTVRLSRTDQGIGYEIDPPNTTYAEDAIELVKGRYVTGSSFEIEGVRSKFSTDPDGSRVRRITHIDRLTDVSPVFDPAFSDSSVVAFQKEKNMPPTATDQDPPANPAPAAPPANPAPQPASPPAPTKDEPRAQFAQTPDSLYEASLAFARNLTKAQLDSALDGAWAEAGTDPDALHMQRIEAFTKVSEDRRAEEAKANERKRNLRLMNDMRRGIVPKAPEVGLTQSDDYKEAFGRYLRGDANAMEQFAQSIAGTGAEGGYFVPDGFLSRVTTTMKAYGGIQSVADSITTADGQPLRWPTMNDTANTAVIATEGSAAGSAGADLVIGNVTLGAYTYDATGASNLPLLVSKELLQDSSIDIEARISAALGERLGRKMAADFATANGSSKPFGLLAKTPDTMTATTLYAALVEHLFQVDQAYREGGNCRWVLSDSTLAKVYNSVDLQGRPLFIPAAEASGAGRPAGMLLGYPVQLDQGAGTLVGFGDIKAGYIIRYVRSVQIDVDPYSNIKSRQIAYHGWARADANIQDSAAYSVSDYSGVSADATD